MKSAVASVLNKVLGEFCEDLDTDNLNIGLFSGTVVLQDITIKRSAIERMGFPFSIQSGFLRRVFVRIPWTSLTSSPLQIEISGLHLLFETMSKEDWDTSLVQDTLDQTKQMLLGRFEIMHSPEVVESPGFTERLVRKIVNNLQIEINGVYIRLEDRISSVHPFALGLVIKRVAAVTCNSAWRPEFIEDSTVMHKLLSLEGVSVHLDSADPAKVNSADLPGGFSRLAEKEISLTPPFKHSYIIEPIFLTLKLVSNKDYNSREPQMQATLRQSALRVRMEDLHVTNLLKFSEFYGEFCNFCKGVQHELTTYEFNEAAAIEYRGLYRRFKQNGKQEAMIAFEQKFNYEDLARQRLIVLEEMKLEEAEEGKLEEIAKLQEEPKEGYFTGVKSWLGYGKSNDQKSAEEQERLKKIESARAELASIRERQSAFTSKMSQFLEDSEESRNDMPEDYVKMQVSLEFEKLQFSVCKGADTMLTFLANEFTLKAGLRPTSVFIEFGLQGTKVQEFISGESVFPVLMQGGVFEGRYDQYPHTIIGLRGEAIQVVVNLKAVLVVAKTFSEAVAREIDLDEYSKQAAALADEYIQMGREYVQGMLQGDYKYNSIDLRLFLKAPVIIVPLDLKRPSEFMVLDLGHLETTTHRVAKILPVVDYKLISAEDQLYDTYTFCLSDVAVSSVEFCREVALWREGTWAPLYSQTEMLLQVSTCIIKDHPLKPVLRVDFTQRDLRMHLSDRQLIMILRLKAKSMETFEEFMPAVPELPVQYIGVKDRMKNFGSVISQVFSFRVESLVIEAKLHGKSLLRLSSQQFSTVVQLGKQGGLSLQLQLGSVLLEDLRTQSVCPRVLYNPTQPDVFGVDDAPQLSVLVEIRPQDDFTKIAVTLSDLCLSASPDFISSMLLFASDPFSEFASPSPSTLSSVSPLLTSEIRDIGTSEIKPRPASIVEAQRSLNCYFMLTNFQLKLPDRHRKLSFHFATNSSYISKQHYQYQLDAFGYVQDIEYTFRSDEASAELFQLGLQVLSNDNELLSDMLVPCRLTAKYSVRQTNQVQIEVELTIESICVLFGFRDLRQIQDLTARWLEVMPQSSERIVVEEKPVEKLPVTYQMNLQCDSILLQLTDDTVAIPYSLISAQVPNLTAAFEYSASLVGSLSISFNASYYNVPKSVWEPLIEDWALDVTATESDDIALAITSMQTLNLNLSFQMLQVVATLNERLSQSEDDWGQALGQSSNTSNQASIYNLVNKLGVDILVWVDVPSNADKWLLKPDEERQMSRVYIEDTISAHSTLRKASLYSLAQPAACIAIEVPSLGKARGLSLDDLGTKGFMLKDGSQTFECVMTIAVQGRGINVAIESSLHVMNNLDFAVTLINGEERLEIEGLSSRPVPLRWIGHDIGLQVDEGLEALASLRACVLGGRHVMIDKLTVKVKAYEQRRAVQAVVQLNPAFSILNLLPCMVSVHLEAEDDDIAIVEPGTEMPVYSLKPGDSAPVQIRLRLGNSRELDTELISLEKSRDMGVIGNFPAHKLSLCVEPYNQLRSDSLDLRFSNVEATSVKAKTVKLYAKFLLVNKTDFALECGRSTKLALGPHSFSLFKSNRSKLKVRLAASEFGEPTNWSDGFNIESVGLAGSINLINKAQGDGPSSILLGVVMQNAPPPLIMTKIVYIVPRFILHNALPFSVIIKQVGCQHTTVIQPGAKIPLLLEDPSQPRVVTLSTDEEHWSAGINVENIEDFQIKVQGAAVTDREPRWYEPTHSNYCMHFVRIVVISEDDATIFINLLTPRDPEFQVLNLTPHVLSVRQLGAPEYHITAGEVMPFAFDDPENRKVLLRLEDHELEYSFEKVKRLKNLQDCKVSCMVVGVTRVLQVSTRGKVHKAKFDKGALIRYMTQSKSIQKAVDLQVELFAIGLSMIDDTPKERFFMSLSEIQVHLRQERKTSSNEVELKRQIEVKVGNVQLDNMACKETQFRVVFCPSLAYGVSEVPFFQFGIHMVSVFSADLVRSKQFAVESASMDRITLLNVSLQEMQIKLDQTAIYEVVDLLTRLEESLQLVVSEIRRSRRKSVLLSEDVFPCLQAHSPVLSFDAAQMSRKSYIQDMTIFGVKVVVSLRLSQRKLHLNPSQGFGLLVLLSNFGSALANVTESPLYFKAVIFEHLFQTTSNLTWLLLKNYSRQGVLQFYKVLGSSDLLGNPIGLIDKLGSGVLEFFSEPYKGLLKGPGEFVDGVNKGVRALVGNVIAGSFGSVSKITGSLYNIVHEVGGNDQIALKEGDNVFTGVYLGVTGGVTELATGLAGFFTKPYHGAKRSGVFGFFKGIGAGVLGSVTAPLAAALRFGSSVAIGISNTGTLLSKGKIQHFGRMRFPRQFGVRKVLEPYDEELAQAQELLRTLNRGAHRLTGLDTLSKWPILQHRDSVEMQRNSEEDNEGMQGQDYRRQSIACYVQVESDVMVILTLKYLLLLTEGDLKRALKLTAIVSCEVHRIGEVFYFCAATRRNQIVIRSAFYGPLARLYLVLSAMPTGLSSNAFSAKYRFDRNYGRGCC